MYFVAGAAFANCNTFTPASGQSVICDTTAPNPATTSIDAASRSTGVSVAINAGAAIQTFGAAVLIQNNSSVTNNGAVTANGNNGYGIWAGDPSNSTSTTVGYGNTLINNGSIVANGANSIGLYARTRNTTAGNTLINTGTITTNGAISGTGRSTAGIRAESVVASTIINSGTVTARGPYGTTASGVGGDGIEMTGPGTITNTGTVTSLNAYGILGGNGGITVTNAGAISGALGAIKLGTGADTVILQPGSVLTGSIDGGGISTAPAGGADQLIFDGFINPNFGNTILNFNVLQATGNAAVGLTAPAYQFNQVSVDAGSSLSFLDTALTASSGIINNGSLTFSDTTLTAPAGIINDGSLIFSDTTANAYAGPISGNGSLTKQGEGTFTLSGANSYTGPTTIAAGAIVLGADDALGQSADVIVNAGATANLAGTTQTVGALTIAGTLDLANGTLSTSTALGSGTLTTSAGAQVNLAGGELSLANGGTTAPNTLSGPGLLTLTGGTLTVAGANPALTAATAIDAGATAWLNHTNGLGSGAISNNGTLIFTDATGTFANTINGTGNLNLTDASHIVITAANTYSGATNIEAGTTLQAGAVNTLSPNSAVTVAATATLNLNEMNQTIAGLTNAGTVNMGAGTSTVLTTTNYVGAGGAIIMNAAVGSDNSPADRLVIDGGTASGHSSLLINNIDGDGALTTGNGILVVDAIAGGTTAVGAFSLGERVAVGAYEYHLYRGSVDNSGHQNWYLRNTYTPESPILADEPTESGEPSEPSGRTEPGEPSAPSEQTEPTSPETPPTPLPDYRIEVPVDSAVPALVYQMGLAMIGSYHDRAGEDYASLQGTRTVNGVAQPSSTWGRIFGMDSNVGYGSTNATPANRLNTFLNNGPSYNYDLYGFQAGVDLYRSNDNGSRNIVGFAIGAERINSQVKDIYTNTQAGTVALDGFSLSGYWTHKGDNGWYLDNVVQLSRYEDIHAQSLEGQELHSQGSGMAVSLESGYPFALGHGWALEPQAQAIYQHISLNGGHDDYGRISYVGGDALYGRVGLRLLDNLPLGHGALTTWLRLNAWGAAGPNPKTTFATLDGTDAIAFGATLGRQWWDAQWGLAARITPYTSVFGSVDYSRPFGAGITGHAIGGRVGVRVTW